MEARFVGGRLNGLVTTTEEIFLTHWNGKFTPNNAEKRARGILCARAELDNQPKVNGYVGPMWNGDHLRYESTEAYAHFSA